MTLTHHDLYAEVIPADRLGVPCRVYAPVGSHEDLLPYLVRRLVENGANSSFVNRITDSRVRAADLVADPVATVERNAIKPHPHIPQPRDLFRSQNEPRTNSMGINLANDAQLRDLAAKINAAVTPWSAQPLVPGATAFGATVKVTNPADRREAVGEYLAASEANVQQALANGVKAQPGWDALGGEARAASDGSTLTRKVSRTSVSRKK